MFEDIESVIPLLPYQREDVLSLGRFRWCCWSRQSGKSFTKALRRILRGIHRRRTQVFLSAGERQSRELMLKARQHCESLRICAALYEDRIFAGTSFRQLELHLPNGVRIIGLPANPQTARGFSGDVLLDEFAMHADDRDIWAAMFPTLLRGDGELDIASTPKGRGNMFYRLRRNEQFSHSIVTLPAAIAAGLPADLEEMRRSMGDDSLFRQEFLCEFLDESSTFLTHEQIAACEDATLPKYRSPVELAELGEDLFMGVDVGRVRDLTVIWIVSRKESLGERPEDGPSPLRGEGWVRGSCGLTLTPALSLARRGRGEISYATRCVIELSDAPFRAQELLLRELLALRCVRRCCIDATGLGAPLAEALVEDFGPERVEPLHFTTSLKAQLAGALRRAVQERRVRIPVGEAIRNDWHSVERSVSPSGLLRLDSARQDGSHADRFWAAALALRAAGAEPGRIEMLPTARFLYARVGAW